MKSMFFWTICLDLEVSELLENLMWKEHSIFFNRRELCHFWCSENSVVLNIQSLNFPHLFILLPEHLEGLISPAQPLLGLKVLGAENRIRTQCNTFLWCLPGYQSYQKLATKVGCSFPSKENLCHFSPLSTDRSLSTFLTCTVIYSLSALT